MFKYYVYVAQAQSVFSAELFHRNCSQVTRLACWLADSSLISACPLPETPDNCSTECIAIHMQVLQCCGASAAHFDLANMKSNFRDFDKMTRTETDWPRYSSCEIARDSELCIVISQN